jgi:hypothetical protein
MTVVPEDQPPVGVEEEYFLTAAESRAVADGASAVLPAAVALLGDRFSGELMECQVEAKTPPCTGPGTRPAPGDDERFGRADRSGVRAAAGRSPAQ